MWCTFLINTFNPIFEIYKNRKRKNLKILWSYLIHWRLSHKLRILKGFSIWCLKIISQNSIGVCIDHLDWLNSNENKIVKVILIKSMAVNSESSRPKIRWWGYSSEWKTFLKGNTAENVLKMGFSRKKPYTPLLRRYNLLWLTLEFQPILGSLPSGISNFTDFQSLPLWNSAYFWRIFVYPYGIPLHFKAYTLGTEMDLLNSHKKWKRLLMIFHQNKFAKNL